MFSFPWFSLPLASPLARIVWGANWSRSGSRKRWQIGIDWKRRQCPSVTSAWPQPPMFSIRTSLVFVRTCCPALNSSWRCVAGLCCNYLFSPCGFVTCALFGSPLFRFRCCRSHCCLLRFRGCLMPFTSRRWQAKRQYPNCNNHRGFTGHKLLRIHSLSLCRARRLPSRYQRPLDAGVGYCWAFSYAWLCTSGKPLAAINFRHRGQVTAKSSRLHHPALRAPCVLPHMD